MDWRGTLVKQVVGYNNTYHTSIRKSPHAAHYGFERIMTPAEYGARSNVEQEHNSEHADGEDLQEHQWYALLSVQLCRMWVFCERLRVAGIVVSHDLLVFLEIMS